MTTEAFDRNGAGPSLPSKRLAAPAKHDTNDEAYFIRQLYVGGTGDVVVVDFEGATVTFKAVPAGSTLGPFVVRRVKATGTTATDLVAYF